MVVSAQMKPRHVANAFKSYATRKLRECSLLPDEARPWSKGRSRRYLWKAIHVDAAIDYVLYCQGEIDFENWYEINKRQKRDR